MLMPTCAVFKASSCKTFSFADFPICFERLQDEKKIINERIEKRLHFIKQMYGLQALIFLKRFSVLPLQRRLILIDD